jgi:hypothetical protein
MRTIFVPFYLFISVFLFGQETILYPSHPTSPLFFGRPVAASESFIVFGAASGNPNFQSQAGAVYVFEKEDTEWLEKLILTASDAGAFDRFGSSLAINNEHIFAGTPLNDNSKGGVYVFSKVDGEWVEETKLTALDGQEADGFGFSVALFDDVLAVGAYGVDVGNAMNAGAVYLYKKQNNEWIELEKILPPEPINSGFFGFEVEIDDEFLFVTGSYDLEGLPQHGRVIHIYEREGVNWNLKQQIYSMGDREHSNLGSHIRVSEDRFIVNTVITPEELGYEIGAIRVYQLINEVWEEEITIYPEDLGPAEKGSDALDILGNRIAFSIRDTDLLTGTIYVYEFQNDLWEQKAVITPSNSTENDQFGRSGVELLESSLVTGAFGNSTLGDQVGAGYIYDLDLLLPVSESPGSEIRSLSLYPNPTTGEVHFSELPLCTDKRIKVFNVQGQLLRQGTLRGDTYDLSGLPNGLYWIEVSTCEGVVTEKVVVT